MSFTPKTWGTGDTVYPSDLTRFEQGIANSGNTAVVIIDYTNTTAVRSMIYYVALCREETHGGYTELAIKAWVTQGSFFTSHRGVTVTPVLSLADIITDDYDVCILFEDENVYGFNVSTVGDIFKSELVAAEYNGSWASLTYGAFVVQGNGKIILSDS